MSIRSILRGNARTLTAIRIIREVCQSTHRAHQVEAFIHAKGGADKTLEWLVNRQEKQHEITMTILAEILTTGFMDETRLKELGGRSPFKCDLYGIYIHFMTRIHPITKVLYGILYVGSACAGAEGARLSDGPAGLSSRTNTYTYVMDRKAGWVKQSQGMSNHGTFCFPTPGTLWHGTVVKSDVWFTAAEFSKRDLYAAWCKEPTEEGNYKLAYYLMMDRQDNPHSHAFRQWPEMVHGVISFLEGLYTLLAGGAPTQCRSRVKSGSTEVQVPVLQRYHAKNPDTIWYSNSTFVRQPGNARLPLFEPAAGGSPSSTDNPTQKFKYKHKLERLLNENTFPATSARYQAWLIQTQVEYLPIKQDMSSEGMPGLNSVCDSVTNKPTSATTYKAALGIVEMMKWDEQGRGAIVECQSDGKLVTNSRITQRWFLEALQTFLKFDSRYSTGDAPAFQHQTSNPIQELNPTLFEPKTKAYRVDILCVDRYGLPTATGADIRVLLYDRMIFNDEHRIPVAYETWCRTFGCDRIEGDMDPTKARSLAWIAGVARLSVAVLKYCKRYGTVSDVPLSRFFTRTSTDPRTAQLEMWTAIGTRLTSSLNTNIKPASGLPPDTLIYLPTCRRSRQQQPLQQQPHRRTELSAMLREMGLCTIVTSSGDYGYKINTTTGIALSDSLTVYYCIIRQELYTILLESSEVGMRLPKSLPQEVSSCLEEGCLEKYTATMNLTNSRHHDVGVYITSQGQEIRQAERVIWAVIGRGAAPCNARAEQWPLPPPEIYPLDLVAEGNDLDQALTPIAILGYTASVKLGRKGHRDIEKALFYVFKRLQAVFERAPGMLEADLPQVLLCAERLSGLCIPGYKLSARWTASCVLDLVRMLVSVDTRHIDLHCAWIHRIHAQQARLPLTALAIKWVLRCMEVVPFRHAHYINVNFTMPALSNAPELWLAVADELNAVMQGSSGDQMSSDRVMVHVSRRAAFFRCWQSTDGLLWLEDEELNWSGPAAGACIKARAARIHHMDIHKLTGDCAGVLLALHWRDPSSYKHTILITENPDEVYFPLVACGGDVRIKRELSTYTQISRFSETFGPPAVIPKPHLPPVLSTLPLATDIRITEDVQMENDDIIDLCSDSDVQDEDQEGMEDQQEREGQDCFAFACVSTALCPAAAVDHDDKLAYVPDRIHERGILAEIRSAGGYRIVSEDRHIGYMIPSSTWDGRPTAVGIELDGGSIVHRWLNGGFLLTCVFLPQNNGTRFDQITPMLQLAGILVAQEFLATHASGASGIVIGDPAIITLQPIIRDNPRPATYRDTSGRSIKESPGVLYTRFALNSLCERANPVDNYYSDGIAPMAPSLHRLIERLMAHPRSNELLLPAVAWLHTVQAAITSLYADIPIRLDLSLLQEGGIVLWPVIPSPCTMDPILESLDPLGVEMVEILKDLPSAMAVPLLYLIHSLYRQSTAENEVVTRLTSDCDWYSVWMAGKGVGTGTLLVVNYESVTLYLRQDNGVANSSVINVAWSIQCQLIHRVVLVSNDSMGEFIVIGVSYHVEGVDDPQLKAIHIAALDIHKVKRLLSRFIQTVDVTTQILPV